MKKLVCGVGINDADYNVYQCGVIDGKKAVLWSCPFYNRWLDMMKRCYSKNYQLKQKQTSYIGSSVCDDWIYFSKFKAWMIEQDWEGKQLDKDILNPGNRVYSPETCVFIDQTVNLFLTERAAVRGEWPIGVSLIKATGRFKAACSSFVSGGKEYLGTFANPEDAHKAWLECKRKLAQLLAAQQTDERVAKALIDRYENYSN